VRVRVRRRVSRASPVQFSPVRSSRVESSSEWARAWLRRRRRLSTLTHRLARSINHRSIACARATSKQAATAPLRGCAAARLVVVAAAGGGGSNSKSIVERLHMRNESLERALAQRATSRRGAAGKVGGRIGGGTRGMTAAGLSGTFSWGRPRRSWMHSQFQKRGEQRAEPPADEPPPPRTNSPSW